MLSAVARSDAALPITKATLREVKRIAVDGDRKRPLLGQMLLEHGVPGAAVQRVVARLQKQEFQPYLTVQELQDWADLHSINLHEEHLPISLDGGVRVLHASIRSDYFRLVFVHLGLLSRIASALFQDCILPKRDGSRCGYE